MKISIITCLALSTLLGGCSMTGSNLRLHPEARIAALSLAAEDGEVGFKLNLMLSHQGLQPLPIQRIRCDVLLNGQAASALELNPDNVLIPGGEEVPLQIFVPANLLSPLSRETLASTRMLIVELSAAATVIFFSDAPLSNLNPTASFEGVAKYEL